MKITVNRAGDVTVVQPKNDAYAQVRELQAEHGDAVEVDGVKASAWLKDNEPKPAKKAARKRKPAAKK